jgi:hypothetical protein
MILSSYWICEMWIMVFGAKLTMKRASRTAVIQIAIFIVELEGMHTVHL